MSQVLSYGYGGAQAAVTSFVTAEEIINDTAIELGLIDAEWSDVYGETDGLCVQLRRLLKKAGRRLWREKPWTQLTQQVTFLTTLNTTEYQLPGDFGRPINDTAWNRTSTLELGGPTSPQDWQYLQARQQGVVLRKPYRLVQEQLHFHPPDSMAADLEFAYEYISRFWVMTEGSALPDESRPTANSDVIWYDSELAIAALKLAWCDAKGFDNTAALSEYVRLLGLVTAQDGPAAVLGLSPSNSVAMLGYDNLPDTGIG